MFSIQELRSSTGKELMLELAKTRKEMLKIRINLRTKHEKDTSKAQKTKQYLAQILTILNETKDERKVEKIVTKTKILKKKK